MLSCRFGPDKCGAKNKIQFIIQYKNPFSGEVEEKQLVNTPNFKMDNLTHNYMLMLDNKGNFFIQFDSMLAKKGRFDIKGEFDPNVFPSRTIDDPTDKKPEDWDEREFIEGKLSLLTTVVVLKLTQIINGQNRS